MSSSTMSPEKMREELEKIRVMPHEEMARLWRFGSCDHMYFDTRLPFHTVFVQRFYALGGMTASVSKRIGF